MAQINTLTANLGTVLDNNEELRHQLGLPPDAHLDLTDLQRRRKVEQEQLRTVNRLLQEDVERLEDERLALKQKLLTQAMQRGQRAVELGLTAQDLEVAEEQASLLQTRSAVHAEVERTWDRPSTLSPGRPISPLKSEFTCFVAVLLIMLLAERRLAT